MSHGKIRADKTCQNCSSQVTDRFCSFCGQENTETRQPFHYLFTHFVEDFVHYDGSFWSTIRRLFFKPGVVTKEYLSGKRNSSVNPVKLYIFVSFMTFFTLAVFPSKKIIDTAIKIESPDHADVEQAVGNAKKLGYLDSIQVEKITTEIERGDKRNEIIIDTKDQASLDKVEGEFPILKPITKKIMEVHERKLTNEELFHLFKNNFLSAIPKGLFIYMPIFAFVLWVFYNKKQWWYFDHGIHTLHYFSTLLLSVTLITVLSRSVDWIDLDLLKWIIGVFNLVLACYLVFIFYKSANVLYGGSKWSNLVKISFVLFFNTIIFTFLILGIVIYAFLKL